MGPPKLISTDHAVSLLREVVGHSSCALDLLTYTPVSAAELRAMTASERERRSAAATTAVQTTPEWQRVRDAIRALGGARFAPAVDLLARIWRHAVIVPLRTAAGHALFDIGTAEAHKALQAALGDAEPHGSLPTFLAIKSIVATAPLTAFDRLEAFFHETSDARFVADEALRFFAPATVGRYDRTWWLPILPGLLRDDRRWIRAAIRLRRDPELGPNARALLSSLPPAEVDAALAETPDPPPALRPNYVGPRDLLARYERGETEAVWRWLRRAGTNADDDLRAEALAVAEATMRRVRCNVERVTERLRTLQYPFDGFSPPWAPPGSNAAALIQRIERAAGATVPATLCAFWTVVGSVYWKFTEREDVADMWRGLPLRKADPLCINGVDAAWWCIEEWQQEVEASHRKVVGPPRLDLAPDYLHKANISGGEP